MFRLTLPVLLLVLTAVCAAHADLATLDRNGRLVSVMAGGEEVPVGLNLRFPLKGWGRQPTLADAKEVKVATTAAGRTFSGRVELEPGKSYEYQETVSEEGGTVRVEYTVTARAEVELEGVYFWLDLPQAVFAGAGAALSTAGAPGAAAVLPPEQPQERYVLRGEADAVVCRLPREAGTLSLKLDRPLPVTIQDNREWRTTTYSVYGRLVPGLAAGGTAALRLSLQLGLRPDQAPATVVVDRTRPRYHLDGFGGNYCFNIESPVTQYTLSNLRQAWARTELTATEWEPRNDNDDPAQPDWAVYEAADKPDSNLRREFLLARQLQDQGLPYVISIWDLPGWLYEDGGTAPRDSRHRVADGKWPELLELLGTYLSYAKRRYGVEPDLLCFNEANIGVRVLFTPEEHREAIKRLGAFFKQQGLKTRLLLADATGPRGTHVYAEPAAADPEAMQYVGAVAFHSWGGGSAADYQAWGDLAARLKLPLLVTELGVDAGAWRTAAWSNYSYALAEMRMYQELLLHARPQGTMQWEFTSDYSIVNVEKDAGGETKIVPTVRFWLVKHFCNLTPYHSEALTVACDHPKVLATAFAAGEQFALHVVNAGAAREVTVTGLPPGDLHAVRTSETEGFRVLADVAVRGGQARVDLAERSLLTLSTVAPE